MKKQSESDTWDFTVVKPLVEIITGEDWIMHTKLTEEQKKLKAMGIFVDVSMFLFSFVTGGESLTAGSVVKALMVEMVTGISTIGVTRFANAYNLSPGVTMLLMFLVGTFTGVAANSAFDFIEDGVDDWVRNNADDIHFILFGDGCEHFSYDPVRDYDNFVNGKKVAGVVEEVAGDAVNGKTVEDAIDNTDSVVMRVSSTSQSLNKFPLRTEAAQKECQHVVDVLNSLKENAQKKQGQDSNPVVAILLHEDGTVSVGISGKNKSYYTMYVAKDLEKELNQGFDIRKYTVGGEIDEELKIFMENNIERLRYNDSERSKNILRIGQCAEPKAATVASKNSSPIVGMDIRWRLSRKNEYPYTGLDKVSDSQMDPCDLCKAFEKEYMELANKNKK